MNFFIYRIVFASRESFRVLNERQQIMPAKMAGKLRFQTANWPSVGDYVRGFPQPGGWILIEKVQARFSVLARQDPDRGRPPQILAANVDTLFVVTSANQDLNLNRLERYVAMAVSGGVEPVILVNKIELCDDPHAVLDSVGARFRTLEVVGVSALEGWNVDFLHEYLSEGRTVAFVGSSGVGKSTLTNALLELETAATQEIRGDDDRGRHTTTHRELHISASGAAVIDTPGLRTVGLGDTLDLGSAFADIEELAGRCRFGDCAHGTEPGCAIHSALESGELSRARWENFLKMGREMAYEQRRSNKALQSAEKKRWAKIHMDVKKRMGRN